MDAGLTLDSSSIKVTVDGADVTADATKCTIKTTGKTHSDCTFEIEFADSYVATLANKDIIVTYKATLNDAAKNCENETKSKNETWLKYGNSSESVHEKNGDQKRIHLTW